MTDFLVLVVLIVIIGSFIAKFVELFEASSDLLKWLAIPLLVAGAIWLLSKLIPWLMGTL